MNPLAAALMIDFSQIPERERNLARLVFTHPTMRRLYPDWEDRARAIVAYLRMEAAQNPDDAHLATLVGELSVRDHHFRRWWAGHHVAIKRRGTRTFRHPVVGDITLDWDTLSSDADPDQQLVVYTAEPGTASHEALQILTSSAANLLEPTDSAAGRPLPRCAAQTRSQCQAIAGCRDVTRSARCREKTSPPDMISHSLRA